MKERPIPFSAEMVRAILAGAKTETRRVIKDGEKTTPKYGVPGDRLWVRETWMPFYRVGNINSPAQEGIIYRADDSRLTANVRGHWKADRVGKWRPGISMPRIFSRILLEVTKPERVERVQDITEEGAKAEGFANRQEFLDYWDTLNAARGFGWDANPWVRVVSYKLLEVKTPENAELRERLNA